MLLCEVGKISVWRCWRFTSKMSVVSCKVLKTLIVWLTVDELSGLHLGDQVSVCSRERYFSVSIDSKPSLKITQPLGSGCAVSAFPTEKRSEFEDDHLYPCINVRPRIRENTQPYYYNKANEMHYFSNLFWYRILHVSDRSTVHHQQSQYCIQFLTFCWPCISVYLSQYLTNLMHKICFTVSFISCLYMFRSHMLETCRGMK